MMQAYNKHAGNQIVAKGKIYYRALVCYPQMTQLPCKIKGCIHKKWNGRCGLKECRLELDEDDNLTGVCFCFEKKMKTLKIFIANRKNGEEK